MRIDETAFESLEIKKVLSIIRKDCRSDLGEARLAGIAPAPDMADLESRQQLFAAIEEYRDTNGDLPWNFKLSAVGGLLEESKSSGMMIGEELLRVKRLMVGVMRVKEALVEAREEWPILGNLIRDIRDFTKEIEQLSVIEEDGRLADEASDRLRRIREGLKKTRDLIRRKGQNVITDPSTGGMLQERVLSLRNGRYVVLVRQDALSGFPGLVMERSSSGNSIYMEPHSLVELNNQYAVAQQDETAEERRILHKLTERMLVREGPILDAERVMGEIDLFYALSEKIRRDLWHMPELARSSSFDFRRARHPLLGENAVPIDVRNGDEFRSLIITGPNTGGKTVALKTAGVCICLGWYGFPIPAADGSLLGAIDDIYSDIGDEQSIEQNLSTFSAHIKQIKNILEHAGGRSVVLLDELGAGTDPEEGAALGIAILDWLSQKNSLVLATTHHNPIKHYALTSPGVETASVEFDGATLSPTYKLLIGIPGRSNALLIAERLGVPRDILARAKEALHHREVSMEDIIGELAEKRAAIERENERLETMRQETERLRDEYESERRKLEEKRDTLLAEADKKALGILENAESSARSLIKTIDGEARSAAQKKLERTKKHFDKIKDDVSRRDEERLTREHKPDERPLEVGDEVVIAGTNTSGTLESIEGDKAMVMAGIARMELPLKMLRRSASPGRQSIKEKNRALRAEANRVKINAPSAPVGVSSSIMIRGMTVDEALPMTEQFLDRAYRAGYGEVTVIHGRGEGILRREVQLLCKRLPYVESYRLGGQGEGSYGVTIVRFKK